MVGPKPRVRVHMKPGNGPTIDGLLLSKRGGHYKLTDCTVLHAEGDAKVAEGEWYVPKSNVTALQVLYR